MEPFRLRRWRVSPGQLFTCGRQGRPNWKNVVRIPERIVHEWMRNLPGETPVVISLLGKKPDGTSEFSFYPFHGGFDNQEAQRGRPSFQEWLKVNHQDRHVVVRGHPTEDFRTIPEEVLANVASDISQFVRAGKTVILIDSGGQSRTGAVCRYIGATGGIKSMRHCFRDPIPEIFDTARYLDAAVSAHLSNLTDLAEALFSVANCPITRAWLESIWGAKSPYVFIQAISQPRVDAERRVQARMPNAAQIAQLHARDGFHCRYCGIPVIRPEVRKLACQLYPRAVTWGSTNASQHAGFQTLWAQYDHVVPHSYGGTNELDNLVVSCAACNFGKMSYRLDELGLSDPRERPPLQSQWDGLERLLGCAPNNSFERGLSRKAAAGPSTPC